ncbi:MAG: WbqC family protein [Balneolaceae bacterium]|jgi:hypothetical protein
MTSIAIMQPYFFPYIGYFQLIAAADRFIFYDDVNFITRGWINRNRILINNSAKYVTIPCWDASQNKLINEVELDLEGKRKEKILRKIKLAYSKAPYFDAVYPLFERVMNSQCQYIAELAIKSIKEAASYLGLVCSFGRSSQEYQNNALKAADRLIDICRLEQCDTYINPIGGEKLYEKTAFSEKGVQLYFLESEKVQYEQFGNEFVPGLSILDIMMFNNPQTIREDLLQSYKLT